MKTKLERMTPDMASMILGKNGRNRVLNQSRVDALASDIAQGRWRVTHQGIAIDRKGELVDGQHRLAAVVKSGVAITIMVTREVDPETIDAVDTGLARSAHDVLAIADGIKLTTNVRSAYWVAHLLTTEGNLTGNTRYSVHALRKAYATHVNGARTTHAAYGDHHDRLSASPITGTMFVLAAVDPEKVSAFAGLLRSGAGLSPTSPILALRNYVLNQAVGGNHSQRDMLCQKAFAAFDAWAKGEERTILRAAPGVRESWLARWHKKMG